ncbi:MAG: DNA/RNA nuclease SfsA, partial [Pseudomonadota bacterium]
TKHLTELSKIAANGQRAVMLYLVQRTDCDRFGIAEDIDPDYAAAYRAAQQAGVEVVALAADTSPAAITISRNLPTAT